MGSCGVRRGSGQDLVFLLLVQLLQDHTLLVLPLSLSPLLAPKLLLMLHLSPQVGLVRLAGLLLTVRTSTDTGSACRTLHRKDEHTQKHVPSPVLLVLHSHLLHESVQLLSVFGQFCLSLHVQLHCST